MFINAEKNNLRALFADQTCRRRYIHNIMDSITIESIPPLNKENVFIRNSGELLKKIRAIVSDGPQQLHIVSDFDLTLTRHFKDDGTPVSTTYDMFNNLPSVSRRCKDAMGDYAKIYKPHEEDGTITIQKKTEYMVEWYQKVHDVMKGEMLAKAEVKQEANKLKDWFRHGVKELVEWTDERNVPFLVFSAGIGNCAQAVLEASNLLKDKVKIIANFCKLDENEKIVGMKGAIIHTLNKNETLLQNTEYMKLVETRGNAILLGDNLGDAGMTDGMPSRNVIKVGFLSREVEKNRDSYRQAFDIVCEHEHSVDVVNAILKLMN